jgi:WD40 repeat protein
VPVLVHQAAGDWAQARAAHQLEQKAGQIASRRSHLRDDSARFADDVADLRGLREHTQQVAKLAASQGVSDEELEDRPAAAVCPYKGLARFEASDAGFFFGRERLVAELVTHLVGAGLVGVVGPSGSGKSSLARAGLLPALRAGVLPGSDHWRQVLLRPGDHPMAELADVAGRHDAVGPGDGSATAGDGGQAGQAPPPTQGADGWLRRALAGAERLLLVVDQFEEVFTTCQDEGERTAFLATLTQAAQADSSVTVVVAIRADYYGHCAADPDLAGLLAANHLLVGPMRQDELRRAVELPAHRAGLHLEPGLADAMIGEVADQPGGLPLLSCALLESWQHRHGHTLTLAAYHQAGGVRGAVARLAERAWQQLGADQQALARRILLRLAGPGEGEALVRRRVPLSEFTAGGDERVLAVVEALTDQRLLTTSQDTVEVAHEALLREWPRLRGWLEEDVQGRALHRRLISAAREWQAAGRDPGELYRGARLTGALDWAREHDADLNALERQYLDASRAAAEHEVADARRRAEQEARRARREARISRRLRAALAGLAVVLLLALVASGFALDLRGRAERQALVADSRRLSAQALLQPDLDRSLLLAEQAVRLDDSVDTRSALLTSLLRSPRVVRTFRAGDNQLPELALSRNGQTLAAADSLGLVYLWDTRTGHRLAGPLGLSARLCRPAFSPDGHLLATGGFIGAGGLELWDVDSHTPVRQPFLPRDIAAGETVTDAAFSPDGRVLAAGTAAGDLIFWNPANGALLGPILHPYHSPNQQPGVTLAFARRGATLVTSAPHDKTIVWNLARRRPVRVRTIPVGTDALALSPDGSTVALGHGDDSIILADTATGRPQRTVTGHGPAVPQLAFSPDGSRVASLSDDRTVVVWKVATGQTEQTLRGHASPVTGLAFSPQGNLLYASSLNDGVIAWDLTGTRGLVRQLPRAAGPVTEMAFSPRDPNLLALAQRHGPVTLWDPTRRAQVGKPLAVTGGSANPVAFSADGRVLAAVDHANGAVALFDVHTHAPAGRLPSVYPLPSPYEYLNSSYRDVINGIAFSRDGRRLATGDENGLIVLWDLAKHAPINRPTGPQRSAGVTSVAFSPDGQTLASGIRDGTVFLTQVPDDTPLHILTVASTPTAIAFSPDGNTLATAGSDGQVRLWDPHTGTARGPAWTAAGGMVLSVSFSPDGSVLATSGGDGTAALWDVGFRKQIGAPLTGPPGPTVAAFDPTGHTIATASRDGTVLLWDVNPTSWQARACAIADRRLTPQEWREFLPDRPYQPSC